MDIGVGAGLASLVLQAQAFFTLAFAALLGERLRRAQLAGMALALLGLGLVATGADGADSLVGLGLVVLAAAAWGVGNLVIKRAGAQDMVAFMIWICRGAADPPAAALTELRGRRRGRRLARAHHAHGRHLRRQSGRRRDDRRLGDLGLPIFGLVSGVLVLGERLTALDLAAAALFLAGLACATARPASSRTVLAVKARASQ